MSSHLEKPNLTIQPTELAIFATNSAQSTQASDHLESNLDNLTLADHNSLSPVSYLTPALLGAIFTECASQWYREIVSTGNVVAPQWVTVLHVCRCWHSAAVNCSALWSFLCIGPKSRMDMLLLLRRSNSSPLYIYFEYGRFSACNIANDGGRSPLSMALEHIDRVEELTFRYEDATPGDILKTLIRHAPLLRSFQIHNSGPPDFAHVRTNIFARKVPRLARLHLANCQVDWSSPIFSENLTHLTLNNITDRLGGTDQFFPLLGKMRKLQKLSWHNLSYARDMQSTDQIELQFLRELNFADNHRIVTMFFTEFKIPAKTVVKLVVDVPRLNLDWNSIHSFIKARFDRTSGMAHDHLPPRSLVLRHSDGILEEICCTTEVKAQIVDNSPGRLQIQFRSGTSSNFYNMLPVSDLEKLTISVVGRVPDMNPWITFKSPQLRAIHLCHDGLGILVRALRSTVSGVVFAPALTEIVLESMKFPHHCICCRCTPGSTSVKCLRDVLARRAEQAHKVQTLVIHDWYDDFKDEIVTIECVDKVEFRGKTMGKSTRELSG